MMRLIVVATLLCVAPGLKLRLRSASNIQSDPDLVSLLKRIVNPPDGESVEGFSLGAAPNFHVTQCNGGNIDNFGTTTNKGDGGLVHTATFFQTEGDTVHCYNFDVIEGTGLSKDSVKSKETWPSRKGDYVIDAISKSSSYNDWLTSLPRGGIAAIRWSHIKKSVQADAPPSAPTPRARVSNKLNEVMETAGVVYLQKNEASHLDLPPPFTNKELILPPSTSSKGGDRKLEKAKTISSIQITDSSHKKPSHLQ